MWFSIFSVSLWTKESLVQYLSGHGTCLGCRAGPWLAVCEGDWLMCLDVSLPPSPSLLSPLSKMNKISLTKKKKGNSISKITTIRRRSETQWFQLAQWRSKIAEFQVTGQPGQGTVGVSSCRWAHSAHGTLCLPRQKASYWAGGRQALTRWDADVS